MRDGFPMDELDVVAWQHVKSVLVTTTDERAKRLVVGIEEHMEREKYGPYADAQNTPSWPTEQLKTN